MSQHQTAPNTNSGTSEKSSQKKRRKRGPNKPKVAATEVLKGNEKFKLTADQEAKDLAGYTSADINDGINRVAAYSNEDMELDRVLDEMAKENKASTPSDNVSVAEVKKVKENLMHLKDHTEDYRPAATMADLTEQVHVANTSGLDSIDATATLVRQIFRKDYDYIEKNVGYGIYHNIRVYIDGHFDKHKRADSQTMEQRLFQGPEEAKKV